MYIKRKIEDVVISAAKQFPVINITGPRQSGKTTLVKNNLLIYDGEVIGKINDTEIINFRSID